MNTLIHCTDIPMFIYHYVTISLPVKIKMMVSNYLLFISLFNVVCEDENIEENEIIDQDYMFEKRVTVRTVEEKNGENIDTFEITKVFVKIISGPYIFSRRIFQGSRARFYCVGCMRLVPPIYTVTKKSDNEYDDI